MRALRPRIESWWNNPVFNDMRPLCAFPGRAGFWTAPVLRRFVLPKPVDYAMQKPNLPPYKNGRRRVGRMTFRFILPLSPDLQ